MEVADEAESIFDFYGCISIFIIYFLIRCFWQRNVKKRRRKKNIT